MEFTNTEMHMILDNLQGCMHCKGLLGYGIARNTRLIQETVQDYLLVYEKALEAYGESVETPSTNGYTQCLSITPDSPGFSDFMCEVEPLAQIKHPVDIFKVPYSDAMDQLTAEQMLQLEWMLVDEQEESCKD